MVMSEINDIFSILLVLFFAICGVTATYADAKKNAKKKGGTLTPQQQAKQKAAEEARQRRQQRAQERRIMPGDYETSKRTTATEPGKRRPQVVAKPIFDKDGKLIVPEEESRRFFSTTSSGGVQVSYGPAAPVPQTVQPKPKPAAAAAPAAKTVPEAKTAPAAKTDAPENVSDGAKGGLESLSELSELQKMVVYAEILHPKFQD